MACVFKKNERWYARYKDTCGRWKRKATDAHTKTEARRLADDLEQQGQRQRLGLDPTPTASTMTVGELVLWWLKEWCPPGSVSRETSRLRLHVMDDPLGEVPARSVAASVFEQKFRSMETAGKSAAYINGLRRVLKTAFNKAAAEGKWHGSNPICKTTPRSEPYQVRNTLTPEEICRLLSSLSLDYRNLFATAILAGLRKGELCGLRKADVNLNEKTITVARSYNRATTKGGHVDVIPIPGILAPFLADAIQRSSSDLVFPDGYGRMRGQGWKPRLILKRALSHAGIVDGYEHVCRRCKGTRRPHAERASDDTLRNCPQCGMKLWPKPIPRKLRFHDLRGTNATLQSSAGAPLSVAQRNLRHRDSETTARHYLHHGLEEQRHYLDAMLPPAIAAEIAAIVPKGEKNRASFSPKLDR